MEVKMNQDELNEIGKRAENYRPVILSCGHGTDEIAMIADIRALLAEIDRIEEQVDDLEHERKDNDALLWKVAEQQKEIERLRAALFDVMAVYHPWDAHEETPIKRALKETYDIANNARR
jgi:hypothetical protein